MLFLILLLCICGTVLIVNTVHNILVQIVCVTVVVFLVNWLGKFSKEEDFGCYGNQSGRCSKRSFWG